MYGLDLKSQIKTNNNFDFLFFDVNYWTNHVKMTKRLLFNSIQLIKRNQFCNQNKLAELIRPNSDTEFQNEFLSLNYSPKLIEQHSNKRLTNTLAIVGKHSNSFQIFLTHCSCPSFLLNDSSIPIFWQSLTRQKTI